MAKRTKVTVLVPLEVELDAEGHASAYTNPTMAEIDSAIRYEHGTIKRVIAYLEKRKSPCASFPLIDTMIADLRSGEYLKK